MMSEEAIRIAAEKIPAQAVPVFEPPATLAEARSRHPQVKAAPGGSDHSHPFSIQIACKHCGGLTVSRDASAAWNHAEQMWELTSVQDQGYCNDCEGEARLVERFTNATGDDLGPIDDWNLTEAEETAKWGDDAGIIAGRMALARREV